MASLEDRLAQLEKARGVQREADEGEARRRRAFDAMYHEMESSRRELRGQPPLPPPEVSAEDRKSDILHTLQHVIPRYKQSPGYQHGGGAEFVRQWENRELEKLSELEKGVKSDE